MKKILIGLFLIALTLLISTSPSLAAAVTVIVTPSNTQGWSTADTRTGGAVNFVNDPTSPLPPGALQLITDDTNAAKAQYLHGANTPITDVNTVGYSTKQVSGPAVADPSYQLAVDLNGSAAGGFTNFVYEPYWNGTVTPGVWQTWDVALGQFWSSSAFNDGTCIVVNGAGGPPFYTLDQIKTMCPNAVVQGFGVNIGTYNPGYTVEADGVVFNDTTYNFELVTPTATPTPTPVLIGPPTNKDQCKDNGWRTFNNPTFRNQGECVSYTNHH